MVSLINSSPAQSCEAEDVLAFILRASAKAGIWQPDITPHKALRKLGYETMSSCLRDLKENAGECHSIEGGYIYSIQRARDYGLVFLTSYKNDLIVLPSQEAVEFFAERCKENKKKSK